VAPKVYEVDYKLKNAAGDVVDTSVGGQPMVFIEGAGHVVKGLEMALANREAGEALDITIPPELPYGCRDQELVQTVHVSQFDGVSNLRPGMTFQTQSGASSQVVRVVAVEGDQVTVDANHPLAGVTLNFEVVVRTVREASAEEVRHGMPLR
jgi:FKBP-type peptidyl-prolyl cis-trans isomerase SlyD